jgi:hypothetical protein
VSRPSDAAASSRSISSSASDDEHSSMSRGKVRPVLPDFALLTLRADLQAARQFKAFLESEHSEEGLNFLLAVEVSRAPSKVHPCFLFTLFFDRASARTRALRAQRPFMAASLRTRAKTPSTSVRNTSLESPCERMVSLCCSLFAGGGTRSELVQTFAELTQVRHFRFIGTGCAHTVLPAFALSCVQNEKLSATLFDGAFDAVAQLLATDPYTRFMRTDFGKVTGHFRDPDSTFLVLSLSQRMARDLKLRELQSSRHVAPLMQFFTHVQVFTGKFCKK